MAVRAVFFDIGGVLVHADLEGYLDRGAALFGATREDLKREAEALVPDLETGKLESSGFWKLLGERLWRQGMGRPADPYACQNLWGELFKDTFQLDLQVLRVCWLLRERVIVGALSNTIREHAEQLAKLGAYQPFQPAILSFQAGLRKPDRAIYELAASKARVRLRECLFVDDLAHNVEAARQAGMRAHHYVDCRGLVRELAGLRLLNPSAL